MKKTFWIVLVLSALLAVSAVSAFAQGNEPPVQPYQPFGNSWRGMGPHMMDGVGPLHESMLAAWSQVLDVPAEELEARLEAGETMYDIAAAAGYEGQEFYGLMLQVRAVALQQAVEDGFLAQEQADWMLSRMNAMGGGGCWQDGSAAGTRSRSGFGRGRGMMGGYGTPAQP